MVRLLRYRSGLRCGNSTFQSHNGAIAAVPEVVSVYDEVGFNPTMVRLLPCVFYSFV